MLELEKSRGADDLVDQMSQALNRLRAMVSYPSIPRQCRGRRRATADGWRDRLEVKCCGLLKGPRAANAVAADWRPRLDGVIGWSRIGAVRSKFTIRRFSIANRQAKDLVAEGEHLPDQLSRNLAVGQLETNKTLPSEVGRYIISPER